MLLFSRENIQFIMLFSLFIVKLWQVSTYEDEELIYFDSEDDNSQKTIYHPQPRRLADL